MTWNVFYFFIKGLEMILNNGPNISTLVGEQYIFLNNFYGQDILFLISNALILSSSEPLKENKYRTLLNIVLKFLGVTTMFYLYQIKHNTFSFSSLIISQIIVFAIIILIWMIRSHTIKFEFQYDKLLFSKRKLGYLPYFIFITTYFITVCIIQQFTREQPPTFLIVLFNLTFVLIYNITFYFIMISKRISALMKFFLTWVILFSVFSLRTYISLEFNEIIVSYLYGVFLDSFAINSSLFLVIVLMYYIHPILSLLILNICTILMYWSFFIIIGSYNGLSISQLISQMSKVDLLSIFIGSITGVLLFQLGKVYTLNKNIQQGL